MNTVDLQKDKKFILTSCFYAFFVNGIVGIILGSLLPMIKSTYNLDYSVSGMLLSAHSLGNLIAGFIAGIVPVYLGRKNSIMLLSSSSIIGFLGMVITGNPLILILAFFLTGIARGSISNFNNVVVTETSDGNPKALNILHSFFAIGAFVAPFLVIAFTRQNPDNWKISAIIVAILALIMLILFYFIKIDNTKKSKAKREKVSYTFMKNTHYWISTGILFFYLCAETAINGWLVTYFKDSGIMSTNYAQTLASLLWLVILFGRLTCAYASQFISKHKMLLASSIGATIFFILLLATQSLVIITISIIGLGFCMSGIYPTTVSNLGNVIKSTPMAMSTLLAISGVGSILMPSITGAVAEKSGIFGGMALITVAIFLNFIFATINYIRTSKVNT